jgi:hypothetical protein
MHSVDLLKVSTDARLPYGWLRATALPGAGCRAALRRPVAWFWISLRQCSQLIWRSTFSILVALLLEIPQGFNERQTVG